MYDVADLDLQHPEKYPLAVQRKILDALDEVEAEWNLDDFDPYPWQRPHVHPAGWPRERLCDADCAQYPDLPTPGSHHGIMLLGGRGTGKTDFGAHYLYRYVMNAPRSTKSGPPHRVRIIAPTLGDAVQCVTGEAGLQSIDHRIQLKSGSSGLRAVFPNHAVARLFGAHTPDDVERLRAGGNSCLVAGTPVLTGRGWVPIESITTDDVVRTRTGWRRVLRSALIGVRPVVRVTMADGRTITGTPDHPVWDGSRYTPLALAHRIGAWQSPTTDTGSTGVRPATTPTADRAYSTGTSTPTRSVPSRPDTRSTTSTATAGTTTRRTSSPSNEPNTSHSIARLTQSTWPAELPSLTRSGTTDQPPSTRADDAASSSRPAPHMHPGTAPTTAATSPRRHERRSGGCALCAATSSQRPIEPAPAPALLPVVRRQRMPLAEPVYDLLVEHDHEYIAAGLAVGNCLDWYEEAGAMRYLTEAIQQARLGLRIGTHAHMLISTTPRRKQQIIDWLADTEHIAVFRGRTADAVHLDPEVRKALEQAYGGTRIGRQELNGEVLTDVEGALWTLAMLDTPDFRPARKEVPPLDRVVVAVDPAVTSQEGSDFTAMAVLGRSNDLAATYQDGRPKGYLLHTEQDHWTPEQAMQRAVALYHEFKADAVVVEANNGGEYLPAVLHLVDRRVPVKVVRATRDKRARAAPVAALYEQKQMRHVGPQEQYAALESQMTTYTGEKGEKSPDLLDACVWGVWDLFLDKSTPGPRGPLVIGRHVGR